MNSTLQIAIGLVLVVAGVVLVSAFPDDELLWFRGQPLGVILAALGLLDLGEVLVRRRR